MITMKFTVSEKIFDKFPNAKFGALLIEGIDNVRELPELQEKLQTTIDKVVEKHKSINIKQLPQIASWREVFKTLGLNRDFLPSHEALLTRIMSKEQLPNINPLVDIYNMFSLKYLIPIGGHNADNVQNIRIDETTGDQTFDVMHSDEVIPVAKGEFAYLSGNKVLTRHFVWRQSNTSKTDGSTQRIFIPIDNAAGDMDKNEILQIAREIAEFITRHLGGVAKMGYSDSKNREINFDKIKPMSKNKKDPKKNFSVARNIKVDTDPKKIDEILKRGCVDVIEKTEIRKKLLSGKMLNIYYGIDPTGREMHLGHASTQRKMRDFQELGHNIILLIGDYTVRVGDHSDQEKQRQDLSDAQIEENMKTFKLQYGKTVDVTRVTLRYNSEWLSKLRFIDVIELAKIFTVQQMIERDAFAKRLKANSPIGFDELLYPLMQGYDAYALKTDIQVEGTDQLFNMIAGRKIMEHFDMEPQGIITMPMLIGPDGREMHKSLGNYIAVEEEPHSMYGKIMSMKDEVMIEYFTLLTRIPLDEIRKMKEALKSGSVNPMELKKRLAFEITQFFHDNKSAISAQDHFEKTVQKGETPEEMDEIDYSGEEKALPFAKFLVAKGFIASNADAKRLINQGGIQIDGKKVSKLDQEVSLQPGSVVQIGKRMFVRIK